MAQLTLYLDDATNDALADAAKRDGKSRSAWAREVLKTNLVAEDKWPDWWIQNLGTLEDDRTAEEIIAEIDSVPPQRPRAEIA